MRPFTRLLDLSRLRFAPDVLFALAVSAIWLIFYNLRFWQETVTAMWHPAAGSVLFLATVTIIVLYVHALLLLMMPMRVGMRIAASALFIVAAAASYFTSKFGALMDGDMIRNVVQTDTSEASDLISVGLLVRVTLMGLVPTVLLWCIRLPQVTLRRQLLHRATFAGVGALLVVGLAVACSANLASFLREHKPVRSMVMPLAPVWSSTAYALSQPSKTNGPPELNPGGEPWRVAVSRQVGSRRPLVVVLVVGETARAANFQLGGYTRPTTPELAARRDLTYFDQASSCGTSTAISVPCMFSHLGREEFRPGEAGRYMNLLDTVQSAGIAVQWRENNSGCKKVCARVPTLDYFNDATLRTGHPACHTAHCYDDVVLGGLPEQLAALAADYTSPDTFIVVHQNGSHGPAYFERYPPEQEVFRPACHSAELGRCSREEVVAAYDNSIRYTDHVLARLIEDLEASGVASLLLYVSDHGESLGEKGIFLHGMPYAFAPPEQKHVPMLMWMSDSYRRLRHIDAKCLAGEAATDVSHDNLYHTLFGALGVRNRVYRPELDLVTHCANDSALITSTVH